MWLNNSCRLAQSALLIQLTRHFLTSEKGNCHFRKVDELNLSAHTMHYVSPSLSPQEVHEILKDYELKYCFVDRNKGTGRTLTSWSFQSNTDVLASSHTTSASLWLQRLQYPIESETALMENRG